MWAIPTGTVRLLKKKNIRLRSPSPESRTPNSVRIRQSGRTGNRGVTSGGGGSGLVETERAMKLAIGVYGKVMKKQAMRTLIELGNHE